MAKRNRIQPQVQDETAELKSRLAESEETLQAIRQYMVDAFVVNRADGTQVITLHEAEFPYRTMVESMNEGAVTLIPDGTIFYCNRRFGEMVQMESEKLTGIQFRDLILSDEQSAFDVIFKEAGQEGARGEFCLQSATGECMPVQLSVYQLTADGVSGISIIATDITERRQAEEALRKSESLFRLMATSSPDVILSQDRNLRFNWIINSIPSFSSEQVIGKTDWDFLPPQEAQRFTEFKERILKTGVSARRDVLFTSAGIRRWYDVICQPTYDETGQIAGIVSYARDITERKQAEEKIRSLASKLTIAEQKERNRISQILHDDLQQQLFAIKAQLSMLRDANEKNEVSSEIQTNLDQIQSWLSDAITMTRNLSIDLSPIVPQEEGLTEAIDRLCCKMKEQYGLEVSLEAKESFHHLDHHMRVLLFQAVRELLFNIVKHAGSLQATVTLEHLESRGRITVCDSGTGFEVEAIMNDPQAAHGLLIIQDRLGLMGCKMEVTSKPGEGTRAVIETPLGEAST
ncbi:MAG TPA: PAS domain S-box protein [Anaerolineales bacterium]